MMGRAWPLLGGTLLLLDPRPAGAVELLSPLHPVQVSAALLGGGRSIAAQGGAAGGCYDLERISPPNQGLSLPRRATYAPLARCPAATPASAGLRLEALWLPLLHRVDSPWLKGLTLWGSFTAFFPGGALSQDITVQGGLRWSLLNLLGRREQLSLLLHAGGRWAETPRSPRTFPFTEDGMATAVRSEDAAGLPALREAFLDLGLQGYFPYARARGRALNLGLLASYRVLTGLGEIAERLDARLLGGYGPVASSPAAHFELVPVDLALGGSMGIGLQLYYELLRLRFAEPAGLVDAADGKLARQDPAINRYVATGFTDHSFGAALYFRLAFERGSPREALPPL